MAGETDRLMDRHTDRQNGSSHAGRPMVEWNPKQTDYLQGLMNRQAGRQPGKQAGRLKDKQVDRWTGRWAVGQADRHTRTDRQSSK